MPRLDYMCKKFVRVNTHEKMGRGPKRLEHWQTGPALRKAMERKEWRLGGIVLACSAIQKSQAKAAYQRSPTSPRNRPALVLLPWSVTGWETSWEARPWCNAVMDFRTQQWGTLVTYASCSQTWDALWLSQETLYYLCHTSLWHGLGVVGQT